MRAARAQDFFILVKCGEFVESLGLDRDELANPSVAESRSVKADHQGTMSAVKVTGIEGEDNSGLRLDLPVEAAVKYLRFEFPVDTQRCALRRHGGHTKRM